MLKKIFYILLILFLLPLQIPFNYINNVEAAIIPESQVIRDVNLIETIDNGDSITKVYRIEGLKLDDTPKQFGGKSIQDLYENGNSNTTIANNLEKLHAAKALGTGQYATHTGWTVVKSTYIDDVVKWEADNQSTDDGYAGKTYTYNQVKDGLA